MKAVKLASAALGLIIGVLAAVPANAWDRGSAEVYAYLPGGQRVEGLAVGPTTLPMGDQGKIYAASNGGTTPNLFVIPSTGCPMCTIQTLRITGGGAPGVSNNLLGVEFTPENPPKLLVIDSGNAQVLNVDRTNGAASVFMTIPAANRPNATLNAMTFANGNVYVSDSTNGAIWTMPLSTAG